MSAYLETGRRSSLLGGLVAAAVLVAGTEPAGGDLERATAALGEAGHIALKTAAKGAIWLAAHHGSAAGEDEETTDEILVVLRPGKHVCPRPRRSCARVVVQRTVQ
jgi:hypothetical protein